MFGQIKDYLQARLKLLKHEAIDTGTTLAAAVVIDLLITGLLVTGLMFFSMALVALVAGLLHSWWAGASALAGLYLLMTLSVLLLRVPVQNLLIGYLIRKIQTHQKKHEYKQDESIN